MKFVIGLLDEGELSESQVQFSNRCRIETVSEPVDLALNAPQPPA